MAKLRRIALLLLAALLCLSTASCDPYGDYPSLIVGSWDNNSVNGRTERFSFEADGTGRYSLITEKGGELIGYDFSYTLEENSLTLTPIDSTDTATHTLSIDGDTMVLKQGKSEQKFTRKATSGQ